MPHILYLILFLFVKSQEKEEETPVCGGFLEFDQNISPEFKKSIDYSSIIVQSFTMDMILKEQTTLAASGYYFLPVYENESFILKISGPFGMNFEPEQYIFPVNEEEGRTIKDICKSDINFKFRGYVVEGQVSTFGSNDGPEGINLALFNEKNEKIQTTKTVERGLFRFKPIPPGNYEIKPLEDMRMFDSQFSTFKFQVNMNKPNFFERALIIRGYKVTGKIIADGDPLEDVSVFVYSYNATLVKNYKCESQKSEKLNDYRYKDLVPFCETNSTKTGEFTFKNIPFGKFLIRPLYKNKYISYSLEPEDMPIEVEHKDYIIEHPFHVNTFSIYGRVVNSKLKGIPNVTIKIDGQVRAISDSNGIYKLENLTPGNYDLEAQADDMFFEPLTNIRVTAHLKSLQDLVVTVYKLCGRILIEATEYFSINKRTVVLLDKSDKTSKTERRTVTDNTGKYCFEVKPGTYHIYPVLTNEEKESDLHLQPESYDVEVVDLPLLDINFYQSKVVLSGKVKCIKDCGDDIKVKLVSLKTDKMLTASVNDKGEYEFKDILSGQYRLAIIKPEWCWEEEDIVIKVQNTELNNLDFKQIGYSLFYSTEHNIDVEWTNLKTKTKQKSKLEKTKSKICLPFEGEYQIIPNSCYKFNQTEFHYDTLKSNVLQLTPNEFLVRGLIELDDVVMSNMKSKNVSDLRVTLNIEQINENKPTLYKTMNVTAKSKSTGFGFYTLPDLSLNIYPQVSKEYTDKQDYKNLLFLPKEHRLNIDRECQEDAETLKFIMKSGLMIEGSVQPGMEGVLVSAYSQNELVTSIHTNSTGHYKIGPLYTEYDYTIKASKDGYKIVQDPKSPYDFQAEKLSFLRVKIVDTNNKSLSSVFLSLSSADRGFKINNSTNAEGHFDFLELYSGEYYIKPLLKEYRFEPTQKFVKIVGGQHYEETIVGHRIAFSIFGKINNLNKERVDGLYIQAYDESTRQLQETAVDRNGEYRLKGLVPGHRYNIKVKIPASSSIEKALPPNVPVTLGQEDITGVDFVVLQRPKKIDIRGYVSYVDEEEDKCPSIKTQSSYVELSKPDDDEDSTPITKAISNSCQFVFRNLEKRKYHIKIFERQGKASPNPRLLVEYTVDLADERDISNGVKTIRLDIEKPKKSSAENLDNTVFSTVFLFMMILSVFKWEYTLWIANIVLLSPFTFISMISNSLSRRRKFK